MTAINTEPGIELTSGSGSPEQQVATSLDEVSTVIPVMLDDLVGTGRSMIPIGLHKRPMIGAWKEYQYRLPRPAEIREKHR